MSGFKLARAVYRAAVRPAGPLPSMITFLCSLIRDASLDVVRNNPSANEALPSDFDHNPSLEAFMNVQRRSMCMCSDVVLSLIDQFRPAVTL